MMRSASAITPLVESQAETVTDSLLDDTSPPSSQDNPPAVPKRTPKATSTRVVKRGTAARGGSKGKPAPATVIVDSGKGPDFTGNDPANFEHNGMVAPRTSKEDYTTFYTRAIANDAAAAEVLCLLRNRISELEAKVERERDDVEQRVAHHTRMLGEHAQSINACQRSNAQLGRASATTTSHLDLMDQAVEDAAATATRIEDIVEDARLQRLSGERVISRLEYVEQTVSALGGGLTRVDEVIDNTRAQQARLQHLLRDQVTQPPRAPIVGTINHTGSVPTDLFDDGYVAHAGAGVKRGAENDGTGGYPAKRAAAPFTAVGVTASTSSGVGSKDNRGNRNGNHNNRRGHEIKKAPAVLPNDVLLTFPGRMRDAAKTAVYVLSLVSVAPNEMVSARFLDDERRMISMRLKTHRLAATVINAVQTTELSPTIRFSAQWSDPNAADLGQALLLEMEGAEENGSPYCSNIQASAAVPHPPRTGLALRVCSWNVHGELKHMLESDSLLQEMRNFDVFLVQETWFLPGEEATLATPDGFSIIARSHPPRADLGRPSGGVAVLFRDELPLNVRESWDAPDCLVVDIGDICIACVYALPASSSWQRTLEVDPEDTLLELLTILGLHSENTPFVLLGDLNARTNSEQCMHIALPRVSSDEKSCCTRGRRLLTACTDARAAILNGTKLEHTSPGAYTSHQGSASTGSLREAVVDYAISSASAIPRIRDVRVRRIDGWSDHSWLQLTIHTSASKAPTHTRAHRSLPRRRTERDHPRPLPPPIDPNTGLRREGTELDLLLADVIARSESPVDGLRALYGPCTSTLRPPVRVWIDGSCLNNGRNGAQAGAGAFFGENSTRNAMARVPGPQTNNRGEHLAAILALLAVHPRTPLIIYADSELVIHSYCHWARKFEQEGWTCANSDLVQYAVDLLRRRGAPVFFRWVKGHSGDKGNDAADMLAKEGAQLPHAFELPGPPRWAEDVCLAPGSPDKVTTSLPEIAPPPAPIWASSAPRLDGCLADSHRGRARAREAKESALRRVVEAAQQGERELWDAIRSITDEKGEPARAPLEELQDEFERRLHHPPAVDGSPSPVLERAAADYEAIPLRTTDTTPEKLFSPPVQAGEIADAKRRARAHGPRSAVGIDRQSYSAFLSIPNDALLELVNQCLESCDAPGVWLVTSLVAILKRGKNPIDAASYRLIGLESCFLKMVTLIIERRATAWMEARGLLPDTQNGFRTGRHGLNNPFILRCAVDRASADKLPLYVVLPDLTNAFPSTVHEILWVKLYTAGMRGPMFDWMRMLYRSMRYVVTTAGERGDRILSSNRGVLAGDSCSPTLFDFYIGDLQLVDRPGDLILDGKHVKHVEQADDTELFGQMTSPLQDRLSEYVDYAEINELHVNIPKTNGWFVNHRGAPPAPLRIRNEAIQWKDEVVTLGIRFCASQGDILNKHHLHQAEKAARVAGALLALTRYLGDLPPRLAVRLQSARLDPVLCFGCEIGIALAPTTIKALERSQLNFLRRVLGLPKRSRCIVVYTETGILPIRHRRLILALRFYRRLLVDSSAPLATHAFRDACDLYRTGQSGWLGDLAVALANLPCPVLVDFIRVTCCEDVDVVIKQVENSFRTQAAGIIQEKRRLTLMRDRVEIDEKGKSHSDVWQYRRYLDIALPHHRKALTCLITGEHALLDVRGGWSVRGLKIAQEWRLCRFCESAIEDSVHALFVCNGRADLTDMRLRFWDDVAVYNATVRGTSADPARWIGTLCNNARTCTRLGKYVFDVLQLFSMHQAYLPPQHAWVPA